MNGRTGREERRAGRKGDENWRESDSQEMS